MKVVIGFAAGSGADILTRFYAAKLGDLSGQSVVVENRPGAIGIMAGGVVAKAKPDGYTMMFSGNSMMAAGRWLVKDFPFDPDREFVPAAAMLETPFVLAVPAQSPTKTVAELVAILKPKSDNRSAYTNPTALVSTELFKMRTGVKSQTVSYRTAADAIPDLANGTLDFMILDGTFAVGQAKAGKIRILAATSAQRITALPDVPTMMEAGVPDYAFSPWWATYLPAGTPQPIVDKIAAWITTIAKSPDTAKFLDTMAAMPVVDDAAGIRARLKKDSETWNRLGAAANLQPQ
jgi:tripartite-type tricarboxylate transporter receptor subunit TctC